MNSFCSSGDGKDKGDGEEKPGDEKPEESPKEDIPAQPEPQPELQAEPVLAGGGGSGASAGERVEIGATDEDLPDEDIYYGMTPKEMIKELDRFVIGQEAAKKAVAIAWRARWRRQKLPLDFRNEVLPKNILMMGPTGCGKTEVARRLARLSYSPFVKVEATKFTEVGYVGKDVNTIIEDLVAHAATLVKKRKRYELRKELRKKVNEMILHGLMGRIQNENELKYW